MFEFLIKRTDGEWFDLYSNQYEKVLRPNSYPSQIVSGWGDHRIEVVGCEISFSFEDPGILVGFKSEDIAETVAQQIADEIRQNIELTTGQKGKVIQIT